MFICTSKACTNRACCTLYWRCPGRSNKSKWHVKWYKLLEAASRGYNQCCRFLPWNRNRTKFGWNNKSSSVRIHSRSFGSIQYGRFKRSFYAVWSVEPTNATWSSISCDGVIRISLPWRCWISYVLAVATRPDISYVVGVLSRFLNNPGPYHIKIIKRVFRYLNATQTTGIHFVNCNSLTLLCYSDSDWWRWWHWNKAFDQQLFVPFGTVCHFLGSRRQRCIALSSTETEYIAASEIIKEMMWLIVLMKDHLHEIAERPFLHLDNQGALKLIKNPEFHCRTKHINFQVHFIREKYNDNLFELNFVPSNDI